MKRLLTVAITTLLTTTAYATPVYHPLGPNLTYGDISNGQTIMSNITNPAAGAAVLKNGGNQYRFGILSSLGAGVEYGAINDLFEEIDNQINEFFDVDPINDINPGNAEEEIALAIKGLNATLGNIEKNGFGKAYTTLHVPLMPIVVSTDWLGGSVVFDANFSIASRAEILHTDIIFDQTNILSAEDDIIYNPATPTTFRVDNDDTLLVRAAATAEIALGYSRLVLSAQDGDLYGGVRGKFYRVGLTQQNLRMGDVEDSKDLFNDIGDEDFTDDTGFGLDIGVLWKSQHYRAGATLTNINEPEFEFNDPIDTGYDINGPVFQRLLAKNKYVMESQLKLEGALFSQNQHWVLGVGFDANAVKDPFGDEYQWATLSAAYADPGWLIPAVRAGYRTNLSGSELSYLTFGTTLFKVFNLDLAYGLDEVIVDGDKFPRSVIVNLGFEVTI